MAAPLKIALSVGLWLRLSPRVRTAWALIQPLSALHPVGRAARDDSETAVAPELPFAAKPVRRDDGRDQHRRPDRSDARSRLEDPRDPILVRLLDQSPLGLGFQRGHGVELEPEELSPAVASPRAAAPATGRGAGDRRRSFPSSESHGGETGS